MSQGDAIAVIGMIGIVAWFFIGVHIGRMSKNG